VHSVTENDLSVRRQQLITIAAQNGVSISAYDLQGFTSSQVLQGMTDISFLNALKEKLFSVTDIKNTFEAYLEFYRDLVRDYQEGANVNLSKPHFDLQIVLSAEREMLKFLRAMSTRPYLDSLLAKEYTMNYVHLCVSHWGPKALQMLRTELAAALDDERVSKEELEDMTEEEMKTCIDRDDYPRDALSCSYLTA
jgi:uncharacterized protein YgfB (UPF0149 family)